jgi:hypothetical chaperone protein
MYKILLPMNLSYGIDFGTTNSTVAVLDGGKVHKLNIDKYSSNPSIMRSITYVSPDLKFLYGASAVDAYLTDVAQGKGRTSKTVYTGRVLKLVADADKEGVNEDEWVDEVLEVDEFLGGRMIQALKSVLAVPSIKTINLFGKDYTLEEVVAGIMRAMKDAADLEIGQKITKAVFGRPVHFVGGDETLALTRMKKAAEIAGFTDIEFEYEPIAAAYDYGNTHKNAHTVLVFDFGGGTLDISVVKFPSQEVLANVGLAIGGDHFNAQIFEKKIARYFGSESRYGPNKMFMPGHIYLALRDWYRATLLKNSTFNEQIDHFRYLSTDEAAIDALRSLVNNNLSFSLYNEIDRAKIELSKMQIETILFDAQDIAIKAPITQDDFVSIINSDLADITKLIDFALSEANCKSSEIDAVATTGGSSLIPAVRKILEIKFGHEKIISSDAFTSVAAGLAIKAHEQFT